MNFKHKNINKTSCWLSRSYFTHCIIRRYNTTVIYIRENRSGNLQWTLQIHWQHRVHKTQHEENKTHTQIQHNTENEKEDQHEPYHKSYVELSLLRMVSSTCL